MWSILRSKSYVAMRGGKELHVCYTRIQIREFTYTKESIPKALEGVTYQTCTSQGRCHIIRFYSWRGFWIWWPHPNEAKT